MFEQSLMELSIGKTKTPWAVAVSFTLQAIFVVGLLLYPLLEYYELPATELMTFLVAPRRRPRRPRHRQRW